MNVLNPLSSSSAVTRRGPYALLVAVSLGLAACGQNEVHAPAAQTVYVTPVRNTPDESARGLTGVLRPRVETKLAFRVAGKVITRAVEVGQTVRAGQVLARVEATDYGLALDAAQDQLRAAQVDATQSASDAERFQRLAADGSVGRADFERQQARADAAAARWAQARRQRDLAGNRLGYATLTAPFDGVVTALRFEAGQVVGEGVPILTLARPGELEVEADIPESLVADLRRHAATATPWDDATVRWRLRLRELAPSAFAPTRTFRARFSIVPDASSPPRTLRMGSTVELSLVRPGLTSSAELPISALLKTDDALSVWVADEKTGTLSKQSVKLVAQTADAVRLGGLPEGALVVSVGAQKLDAGMKVVPVRRPLEAVTVAEARP